MDVLRQRVQDWQASEEGLMLSFVGKLTGLAARLALVLAALECAAEGAKEPHQITGPDFDRAVHLVEAYFLPMARRAYDDAATTREERAARRLLSILRSEGWHRFTTREVLRLGRRGLAKKAELDPALALLVEGDWIKQVALPSNPQGGRPSTLYAVNPVLHV